MNDARILPTPLATPLPDAGTSPVERSWAVAGLHCAACAEQLRSRLLAEPGVLAAQVGYGAALALVQAPASVQDGLPARLRAAGYQLAPAQGASAVQLRQQEARQLLWRVFVAGFCMMQVMMLAAPTYFSEGGEIPADLLRLLHLGSWMLSWPVMLFASQPFLVGAWRSLRQRQLGMDVPVALALLVTFGVSSLALFDPAGPWGAAVYFDSLTMFAAFLLLGRWFELKARHAAAEELARLVAQPAAPVWREDADGGVQRLPIEAVRAGDVLRVAMGEVLPVDGLLLEGSTRVDEALLSGESHPVSKQAGDALVGGSVNLGAPLRLRATASCDAGRAAELAQRLQRALTERPTSQPLAERWARHFLVAVLLLAALAGLAWSWLVSPAQAVAVVCAVLIVTCPCAFALAQPAARVASHRALARQGLLLQRLDVLENLAQVNRLWLDKTGTLTRPEAQLRWQPGCGEHLAAAASAVALASWSRHPVSQAVARCPAGAAPWRWAQVQELPGQGLSGLDPDGRRWLLQRQVDASGLYFGLEGLPPVLSFDIVDAALPGSARWLRQLERMGLRVGLLSGDRPERVQQLAQELGLQDFVGGCSPEGKLAQVRSEQAAGLRVLMVGDGVNDAPVLAQADASLAVQGATALASQAADVLLLRGDLSALPALIAQARRTRAVTRQNLIWAAAYNGLAIPLALAGWLPPWAAGLGMALSSLLVVGNSLRLAH